GFLEYFNHTTLQWVPICDSRFTERNAQVVCRELGYDPLNVYYAHDRRIEFHTNSLTRIWTWVQPLECRGDEARLAECEERLNGQSNLFNHSKLYGRMDSIRLYDGDVYNVTSLFMDQIESDTPNQKSFFKTKGPTLSVHLMASGAPEYHGFIAEVVTVPISTIGQYRDSLHNITYTHITGATKGAITYASAGEVTPTLTLTFNRLQNNCLQLYGNFSTCPSAIHVDVQNMHSFYFMQHGRSNSECQALKKFVFLFIKALRIMAFSTIELWRSKIDARHNYWSYNNSISVQSRIRDKSDDPLLLEVQAVPFQMNNLTILDGKCPPGWGQVQDTCFLYVGVPMSFHEAKEFCRSENSSMPFIKTDSVTLWTYLQSQMTHLKFPEKVWIQDFNHIDRCTSFAYTEVTIEDCGKEMGFICEIDPKVVIDPLSWRADIFAISIISAFILAIILLVLVAICWYAKSKHRHIQRLQRRNSIRQSLRSLNSIDPQGSLRRRNFIGFITRTRQSGHNRLGFKASASRGRAAVAAWAEQKPTDFELSYRNEGFRDNSTYSGTRNNSISTSIAEDTPIIHQTDMEETGSDYYGNASTLPIRHDPNENLAFYPN
ncbi:Protein bark beetle, partial [Eumeta japonica]